MLDIDRKPTFWAPVKVRLPGEEPQDFRAKWRVMPLQNYKEFDLRSPDGTRDFLAAALEDTDEIAGADGKALAFTPELFDRLADDPVIRGQLVKSYMDNVEQAARGN